MLVTVTCPGKSILSGEHSVVYGKPCVVTANCFFMTVRLKKIEFPIIEICWEKEEKKHYTLSYCIQKTHEAKALWKQFDNTGESACLKRIAPSKDAYALIAIGESLLTLGKSNINHGFSLNITTTIPLGKGCGSSAALAASLSGSLYEFFNHSLDDNKNYIENLTQQIEKYIHGRPSGVDGATVIHGGTILFQKERALQFLTSFSFPNTLPLYYVDAGFPKETTGELVTRVKHAYVTKPDFYDSIMEELGSCATKLSTITENTSEHAVLDVFRHNEMLLELLGVVSQDVTLFCRDVEKMGGAAKISGAGGTTKGGGGSILCFGLNKEQLTLLTNRHHFNPPITLQLNCPGLRTIEKTLNHII